MGINQVNAQVVFEEKFTGGMPGTWSVFDVDGNTPATNVNFIDTAWTVLAGLNTTFPDTAAWSTSWYAPAGASNDWMITPAITLPPDDALLTFRAVAPDQNYPDGYEVRVFTVAPNAGNLTTSTVIYTNPGESDTWTNRSISLAAYTGQTIYIAFRNNANDKFLLGVDDVKVAVPTNPDVSVSAFTLPSEYSMMPKNQASAFNLAGTMANVGGLDAPNAYLVCEVYKGTSIVYADSTAPANLAVGATLPHTFGTYTPTDTSVYTVIYSAKFGGTDDNDLDNMDGSQVYVNDSVFARDLGNSTGSLGIGAGNGGYIGQGYTLTTAAEVHSLTMGVTGGNTTDRMAMVIWNTDGTGKPTTIAASTDTMFYPSVDPSFYTLPISGGMVNLPPGTYVVTAVEFDSTLKLAQTADIFTTGKVWVYWPTISTGDWANTEDFGFSTPFMVRLNARPTTPTAIDKANANFGLMSYPNPSTGKVMVSYELPASGKSTILVTDVTGKTVYRQENAGKSFNQTLDLSGLNSGVYMLEVKSEIGSQTQKLVIQK